MRIRNVLFGTQGERQPAPQLHMRNTQLYKKAYMIEFYAEGEDLPVDVFTFSVPPENEELTYSQRKTETKTFGGLHVDDYGVDAVRISLSGSTINQSLKLIHKGKEGQKWLSGEEEIYYFRDLLMKYRSLDNLMKNANGKIIIYDLSKYMVPNETKNRIVNYWRAFPGDFKIRRSNDRPFTYKYTFEFTGVPLSEGEVFESHGKPPELNAGSLGAIQRAMYGLLAALRFVDGISARVNDVLENVNRISSLLTTLGNVMSYSSNALSGILGAVGASAVGLIDGVTNVVDGANSIVTLPRTIQLRALSIGIDLQNATNRLVKSTERLVSSCRGVFESETYVIPQEVLDQFGLNNEEFRDSISLMLNNAENLANEAAAYAKSSEIPEVTEGNPDPITGSQRIILSYGHSSVMLKATDNLESLANEYLGDPDRAIDIATFNGVASLSDLEPGDVIRIPITAQTVKMSNNLIYARREDRDNYGRDILITDDGFIMTSNTGDYELSHGVNNLTQAVLLRLRENKEKRIRINVYGIRTNIGDTVAGSVYILSSVELTIKNDPRVASVDNISFRGEGDAFFVEASYHDINNAKGMLSGRI